MRNFDFYIPILDARCVEKDSVRFSDASESFWNWLEALNHALCVKSVLEFLTKIAKFVLRFGRSFKVVLIRFSFVYVYGMF